ncbi:MAG: tetratricopeptide repeat protein [Chitinivibrionales bacterium]|nr:tetratricopeptide repeat protein [Chitinivibrionales bacterium]
MIDPARRRRRFIAGIVLVLATLGVYGITVRYDFVNFDDPEYVYKNQRVLSGLSVDNVIWAFTTRHSANWHPLTWVSHMIDGELFGRYAGGHHFTNNLLHVANTLLVLVLMYLLTYAYWKSILVAALFALHPLHVESVAWIAERKDVLSSFFMLISLVGYVRYVKVGKERWYALSLGMFVAALLSKPMAVIIPVLMLVLDFWPLGLWNGAQSPVVQLRRIAANKLPFFALTIVAGIVTIWAQQGVLAVIDIDKLSLAQRLLNAIRSYGMYVWKTFVPLKLAVYYPWLRPIPWMQVAGGGGFLIFATYVAVTQRKPHPWLLAGWMWYVLSLAPVIGIVQVGSQAMADRYTYIPLIGFFVMLVWGGELVANRYAISSRIRIIATILVLALLSFASSRQVRHWRNSVTLFAHAVNVTEGNSLAYNNLGSAYDSRGEFNKAIQAYQSAIKIRPGFTDAYNNYGTSLLHLKRYGEAVEMFREVLHRDSTYFGAWYNLGICYTKTDSIDQAKASYRMAIRLKPEYWSSYINLGLIYKNEGKFERAIEKYNHALRMYPHSFKALLMRAEAYCILGEFDKAQQDFATLHRYHPAFQKPEKSNEVCREVFAKGRRNKGSTR